MKILITGAAGFLGSRLAKDLLKSDWLIDELNLVDINLPEKIQDKRVTCFQSDLSTDSKINNFISEDLDIIFHLAAVVSGHAEKDFDIGWKVNMDMTRNLLEACRKKNPKIKFVFTSSCAVYGGKFPAWIDDYTILNPQTSYGTQKAICELMINDYSRKGFIDGRNLRLPTICVRPGKANQAASSFVSGIIREPIHGDQAICPVSVELPVWISSPDIVIQNIKHAALVDASSLGLSRSVILPGISVTVKDMIASLRKHTNEETVSRIVFKEDETISKIVLGWPTILDNAHALSLGFHVDSNIDDIVAQYLNSLV